MNNKGKAKEMGIFGVIVVIVVFIIVGFMIINSNNQQQNINPNAYNVTQGIGTIFIFAGFIAGLFLVIVGLIALIKLLSK